MNSTQVGDRVRICVNGTATAPAYLTAPRVVTWVNPHNCRTIRYGVANCFATSWVKVRTQEEIGDAAIISAGVEVLSAAFDESDRGVGFYDPAFWLAQMEEGPAVLKNVARNGGGMDPPQ